MKFLAPLLLASVLVTGCAASATPGVVHADGGNPLVSIGAGEIELGGGNAQLAWYVIDRASQTCWFRVSGSTAPVDYCQVRRVEAARQHITWATDASCMPSAKEASPTPAPAAAPTP